MPVTSHVGSIEREILERMLDLHRKMDRVYNERIPANGTSLAQFRLLALLDRSGPIRSVDIAAALNFSPRTVTEAVDALELKGFARRTSDPDDRRAKRIRLTPAGRDAIEETADHWKHLTLEFFSVLHRDDASRLRSILKLLKARSIQMSIDKDTL